MKTLNPKFIAPKFIAICAIAYRPEQPSNPFINPRIEFLNEAKIVLNAPARTVLFALLV